MGYYMLATYLDIGSKITLGVGVPGPLFLPSLHRNVIFSIQMCPDDHYSTISFDNSTPASS